MFMPDFWNKLTLLFNNINIEKYLILIFTNISHFSTGEVQVIQRQLKDKE